MARTQRAEQRERTRQQVLDAAVACLVRYGYAGTTTQRVQDEASISRGAVLHHFGSKADLYVAAIQHIAEGQLAAIRDQLAGLETTDPLTIAEAFREAMSGPLFLAGLELWMSARTDDELRTALSSAERSLGAEVRQVFEDLLGPSDEHSRESYETLMVLLRGMALTSILRQDHAIDDAILKRWADHARAR